MTAAIEPLQQLVRLHAGHPTASALLGLAYVFFIAKVIENPALRAQLFRARLAALPVEELRLVLETLIERAGLRSHDAQVALLSVAVALALDFPRMQQVYDAALAPPPSADSARSNP